MIDGPATAALTGAALGLSAGLSPGPLLALVIVQTLTYSVREGAKVAASPLLTDLPIVLTALALTAGLSSHPQLLALLTLCGAGYLCKCACASLRFRPQAAAPAQIRPKSLRKGVLANLLSPSPYLFWGSVGAPLLAQAWDAGAAAAAAFLAGFFGCLIGAKVLVAWLTGRFGPLMGSPAYALVMRALGLMLLGYAGWFAFSAWRLFTHST
ncbi:MAG: LysE family transporter [Humidesulfovibrio sp.]|uniref:LysE family translocator n=1 Tax=Humidesulfovibrio sp. TaxID=2910988 RepID=UPI0027339E18|nr:LysE family transporter [Humidesulfovibrio sp.]MDP2848257.1 LysE family transporter [Humidesulfovibrio sp.]